MQAITDLRGGELTADELLALFHEHYLAHTSPYELVSYTHSSGDEDRIVAELAVDGEERSRRGRRQRPDRRARRRVRDAASASRSASATTTSTRMSAAADATAAAYIEADVDDEPVWGVGLHPSIVSASLRAVMNAVNRAVALRAALATPAGRSS